MLQINSTTRIALAINPVDFRKGIDTLAAYCLKQVGIDPFSGRLFAFRNRAGTAVKLLIYDGNGFGCVISVSLKANLNGGLKRIQTLWP